MLTGYHKDNPRDSPENRLGSALDRSLWAFFSVILSSLSSLIAAASQANLKAAMRVLGHELGQHSAGLDWIRETYLANPAQLRHLDPKKAQDISADLDAFMQHLHFISRHVSIVARSPNPVKSEFLAYKHLIFKWKDIYRLEAEKKSLEFLVAHPKLDDPAHPPVYGDRGLLEQLVYNLVNNAVKYSHRGTAIHIGCCKLTNATKAPHVMSVTDFGRDCQGEDLLGLFACGNNVRGIEGAGIGLFIANQIALAHGGSISVSSKELSSFNIPLLRAYLQSKPGGEEDGILLPLEEEYRRLDASGDIRRVVALDEDRNPLYANPTPESLLSEIQKATFEVNLAVTIPSKECAS